MDSNQALAARRCAAVILCGGRGTRLGDLTEDTPKPLLDICGRSIVEHTLALLERHGITDVFINVHYLADQVRERLGDGSAMGVRISYLKEKELTGTAGPIAQLESELAAFDDVLVIYGDLLLDIDLTALVEAHRASQADATIIVHERARSNSLVVVDEAQRVVRFLERPTDSERRGVATSWVNSGIAVLARSARAALPREVPSDLPRDLYAKHCSDLRIFAHPLDGFRVAIDSPERLELARTSWLDE